MDNTKRGHITVIAAMASNYIVGINNKIPWTREQLPWDLPHFARQTKSGKTNAIIMGRHTWESFGAKALLDRTNIIVSKMLKPGWHNDSTVVFRSADEAHEYAVANHTHVHFIGGTEIWKYGLNLADVAIITHIHQSFKGDTEFPTELLLNLFHPIYSDRKKPKNDAELDATLKIWTRKN